MAQSTSGALWQPFMLFWLLLLEVTCHPPLNWTALKITCPAGARTPGKFHHNPLLGLGVPFGLNKLIEKHQELHCEALVLR